MSPDALAALGIVAVAVGLWLIWPALAIIAVGVVVFSTAIGLALLRRQDGAGTEHREG